MNTWRYKDKTTCYITITYTSWKIHVFKLSHFWEAGTEFLLVSVRLWLLFIAIVTICWYAILNRNNIRSCWTHTFTPSPHNNKNHGRLRYELEYILHVVLKNLECWEKPMTYPFKWQQHAEETLRELLLLQRITFFGPESLFPMMSCCVMWASGSWLSF